MNDSEVQRLMKAVHELGASCAALSNKESGAVAALNEAAAKLRQSRDTHDIADSLKVAGTLWHSIEAAAKAAAADAHHFASSL